MERCLRASPPRGDNKYASGRKAPPPPSLLGCCLASAARTVILVPVACFSAHSLARSPAQHTGILVPVACFSARSIARSPLARSLSACSLARSPLARVLSDYHTPAHPILFKRRSHPPLRSPRTPRALLPSLAQPPHPRAHCYSGDITSRENLRK